MILSDSDIQKARARGDITISPFVKGSLQPASVDLRLDRHFLVFDESAAAVIDPKKPMEGLMREVTIDASRPFVLHPGGFALGLIYETTGVSGGYVGRLEGKSSVGRMGILIHATAGFLDPGNTLKMTLELHNTANLPVLLYYKMPIAQMAFEKLSSPSSKPYNRRNGGKYVGDTKPRASQMWMNFRTRRKR